MTGGLHQQCKRSGAHRRQWDTIYGNTPYQERDPAKLRRPTFPLPTTVAADPITAVRGAGLAGVVIGLYRWPSLAELQVKLIRSTCGDVPILLVCDDEGDRLERVRRVGKVLGVEVVRACYLSDPKVDGRIGHTGGDLAVFFHGLRWAASRGLAFLAKLSQRVLVTRKGWLDEARQQLAASGLATMTRRCRGREVFPLRTEAVGMEVARWAHPIVLDRLRPRKHGLPFTAEVLFDRTRQDYLGRYLPWDLLDEERYYGTAGDIVTHFANGIACYRQLAADLGVTLDPDLHVGGWEKDAARGEYVYG